MRYKIFVFLLLLSTGFSAAAYALEDAQEHGHKSPHGGIVQDAEGMHLEFLLDKSEPKLFLYDKAMKPLERSDLEARLTIKGHGGADHSQTLKFSKDAKDGPLFKGEPIKGLTDWDTAVVSLKLKDGWKNIRFSHHAGGHGH